MTNQVAALVSFINRHSDDGKPLFLRVDQGFLVVRLVYTQGGECFEEEMAIDPNMGAVRDFLGY